MSRLDQQGELALARAPHPVGIPAELVRAKHSSGAAFTLACDASGLVILKTEAERRADVLQEELSKERLKNEVLMQALRGAR